MRAQGPPRIARPALAARIAAALDAGSVLLVAPAGYGKTMAVEEAVALRGGPVAWVGCAEGDRDAGRVLLRIIDALGRAAPGVADVPAERMAAGTEPVDPVVVARDLREDLERLLVDPLVIVLDDAERLEDVPRAADVVGALLDGPGDAVRVVVASRRRLGLRTAKLRAAGRLATLGPADLVFTPDECAALLALREGRTPPAGRVEAVMEATEGWPLGVSLGGLGGATAPGARGGVFDFLVEEVLDRLDRRHREALLVAALPRELEPGVVRALGLDDDVIDGFERLGLFVTPVDAARRRARLHPLVREFLLERLHAERDPAALRELHAALAGPVEEAGRLEDAVDHWLDAGRWDEAAAAVARGAWSLIGTAPQTVRRWLERLPGRCRELPELLLVASRLEFGAGRHVPAADVARRAVAGFRERGDVRMEWRARLALMDALHGMGAFGEAVDLAEGIDSEAVRDVPEAPDLAVMAAMCLSHEGRFEEAAELNRRAREHPAAGASAPLALALEGLFLDRPAGRLDDAVRKARAALARFERSDPFGRAPFVRALLHLVLEEQGHDDEALRESQRAREEARRLGVGGYLATMLLRHSVGIHARAGRLEEAERALAQAGEQHTSGWRQVDVAAATLHAARGEADEAAAVAEGAVAFVERGPWLQRLHAVAFLVPVLVQIGRHARARTLVDETLALAPPVYVLALARLRALRAWLAHLDGDEARADRDLRRAWAQAGDQVPHLLRREWPRLEPLLWPAAERGVVRPDALVTAVSAAFPGGPQLARFAGHPAPAVRRAAVGPALRSGEPGALARLRELCDDPDPGVAAAARAGAEQLAADPPPLAFTLLGGFGVRRGQWDVDDAAWTRPMASRLCRFLLVHRGARVSEDVLFEAFWPEKGTAAARRNLQVVLSLVRAVLDPPGAPSVIDVSERTYRLLLRPGDSVDADDFLAAADAAGRAADDERLAALEHAASLWRGEPLPEDRYAEWATAWRERLVTRYADVLARLAAAHREAGDLPASVHAARRLVELDPLDEAAQLTLIRAYAAAGRRAHALRQYLAFRRALVDALGVEPSAEAARLHARLLAGETV